MKNWLRHISLASLLLIFNIDLHAGEINSDETLTETVEIRFMHASAHEDAFSVDIYINSDPEGEPEISGMEYQSATEFMEFSATDDFSVTVTPSGDDEVIYSDEFEIEPGIQYSAIIRGDHDEDIPGVDLVAVFAGGTSAFPQNLTSSPDNEIEEETPQEVTLSQNYPNPFNATTSIEFQMPDDAHAELKVYNTLGQKVETLIDEHVSAGRHEVSFDASDLSTGVYIYQLNVEGRTITNQMPLSNSVCKKTTSALNNDIF